LLESIVKNPSQYSPLIEMLRPVRDRLLVPLSTTLRDKDRAESERSLATSILADYASDQTTVLADLLLDSEENSFAILFDKLKSNLERTVRLMEAELVQKPAPEATTDARDKLAQRQARAAVALVRLGQPEKMWPLLRHSRNPSVRSYIVNWLRPLGAEPTAIVAKLTGIGPTAEVTGVGGESKMDAILFHPETSMRRALILALGQYGEDRLSPGEGGPLTAKLLDLYRGDPDAGIHGAAEWTLRQWKQYEKLKVLESKLSKVTHRGERRWYVNGQGQTFVVIDGPVEFSMGAPQTEPERVAEDQTPRRMSIPRRFALAAREVTVEQYQRFARTNPQFGHPPSFVSRFSPDPDGPMNRFDWYTAAAYCNWLSEREGLTKDQWCYLPAESGDYAEGMTVPADVLRRRGYRLPTEAEWEYACRAGAMTSRYYGHSINLLGRYAWYQANSRAHAWSGGNLLPNDLGLFDMLGNVFEWCQDRADTPRPSTKGIHNDIITMFESVSDKENRKLRGGSFADPGEYVRSAVRLWNLSSLRGYIYGFRPARTYD
jgi:formylglycine-generating enzyme required for sulfatase activity